MAEARPCPALRDSSDVSLALAVRSKARDLPFQQP